jgi:hypothetical protein
LSTVLSWEARNADYVQLSYTCAPKVQMRLLVPEISIEDPSYSRSCGDPELPDVVANRPPESSQEIPIYRQFQRATVRIQITLTPFSHGIAFKQGSKTLSLDVPLP